MNVKQHQGIEASNDEEEDEESDVFDVEILFKTQNMRKRLDLTVRIIHDEDDEETYVYNNCIKVESEMIEYLNPFNYTRI